MRKLSEFCPSMINLILLMGVLITFLLTITGFWGGLDWRLDLTGHFRPWYFLAELAALLGFLLFRRKWLALTTLIFLVLNGTQLYSLYLRLPVKVASSDIHLKIVQFNVCAPAKDYASMNRFLLLEKPDLVVLEECGDRCLSHLKRDLVLAQYPYTYRKAPFRHRLVVLGKYPLKPLSLPYLPADPAVALLQVQINNRPIQLFAMHSTRPSSGARYYRNQIEQFKIIAEVAAKSPVPFLLIGDLNVSPWNYSFKLLQKESGLTNSMEGFGFQPSFPTFVPHFDSTVIFPLIPLDHVLVSHQFRVIRHLTGPRLQSDHLPVLVELALKGK